MTIKEFDAQLARFESRAARATRNASVTSGPEGYHRSPEVAELKADRSTKVERVLQPERCGPRRSSSTPQRGGNSRKAPAHPRYTSTHSTNITESAPSASKKMTMKNIKAIHAQVQSRVVRNATAARVSRGPVTMGELCDSLFENKDFDPNDHCFPNLPRDFFHRMTSADRKKTAWSFISSASMVPGETSRSGSSRIISAHSSGNFSGLDRVHTSQSTQPDVNKRQRHQRHTPLAFGDQIFRTGIEKSSPPMNSDAVEHSSMVSYGTAAPPLAPFVSTQYAPNHTGIIPYTNTPQLGGAGPYGSQAMALYGMTAYAVNPVALGSTGFDLAHSMAPAPHLISFQGSDPYFHPAPLLPPAPHIHLQFEASRYRMDGLRTLTIEIAKRAIEAGINPRSNYKGDLAEDIRNAQCPEDMNTSVHIEGFPAGASEADVLSVIRFAAVRNISVHPAVPGRFSKAAADITFFRRDAAEYCLNRGVGGDFKFRGLPLKFMWNKNKCRAAVGEELEQSRVLVIEGSKNVVSIQAIETLLRPKLVFKLLDQKIWRARDGNVVIWLEFCKVRGQARCAKKLLEEVIWKTNVNMVVSFGEDPCGPR